MAVWSGPNSPVGLRTVGEKMSERISCGCLVLLGCLCWCAYSLNECKGADPPNKSELGSQPTALNLTIAKATTFFQAPLRPDGTIDYVMALNERYGDGVTKDNNAVPLLIEAIGPEFPDTADHEEMLRRLDVLPLAGSKGCFIPLHKIKDGEAIRGNLVQAMAGPWSPEQFPRVAQWLEANQQALAIVARASRRSRYFVPLVPQDKSLGIITVLSPNVATCRDLGQALRARAMLRVGGGKIESAWADLLTAHRLARLVSQGPFTYERVYGLFDERSACYADTAMALSGKLSAAQARACVSDLHALSPMPSISEVIDVAQRCHNLGLAVVLLRMSPEAFEQEPSTDSSDLGDRWWCLVRDRIDWDSVLRFVNRWSDRQVKAAQLPSHAARLAESSRVEEELQLLRQATWGKFHKPERTRNPETEIVDLIRSAITKGGTLANQDKTALTRDVQDIIVTVAVPSLAKAVHFRQEVEMHRDLVIISLALAAYRSERGEYPAKLDLLTPGYLKEVPSDRFTDSPLKYARRMDGYTLYTVGVNMKDDDGREDAKAGYDDTVVRTE